MRGRITSDDLRDVRMLNIDELQRYLGMGRNSSLNFAKEHGAMKHYGRRCLFDKTVIDKALDELPTSGS